MQPDKLSIQGREYTVLQLLGKGKGGYSYLVTDGNTDYVLKQIHHEPCEYYTFGNKMQAELGDYERLRAIGITMPAMLAVDMEQERILKEYIAGDTVYDRVGRGEDVNGCIDQVRQMCRALYAANTNIDYFPTNFIERDGTLYYIDYECNDYMEEWSFENWGIRYWSQTAEFMEHWSRHSHSGH